MRNFMSCNKTVEGVLQHFDFDKVRTVMEALDWKWCSINSYQKEAAVPSIQQLVLRASNLLQDAYHGVQETSTRYVISCGGFVAEAERHEDGEVLLTLSFVVTDWNHSNLGNSY